MGITEPRKGAQVVHKRSVRAPILGRTPLRIGRWTNEVRFRSENAAIGGEGSSWAVTILRAPTRGF
eukprot:6562876-Prymnesium_polylepis.1